MHTFTSRLSNPSESSSSPNVYCFGEPTSPKPPQAPQLLHKLWDLDLGNVEAIPYVKLCVASPLLPPPLEDVNRYPHFPGPPSRAYTLSGALTTTHTTQHSYVYWFLLLPPSSFNILGTSLGLLGTPSRVTSRNSNYF
ncbi:hypothetical protein F5876DRAFT_80453 [Lentinula aff. lateritia]|uniref:Uncharacterized protein n=1 Tax=Lentinula aff. lateritia TaxID=2804960 RepID=A0ACC1TQM9_9AGAR|nr:hypothetical protein F5876DRAFT_80453 [Lentinula aff. lateritia]